MYGSLVSRRGTTDVLNNESNTIKDPRLENKVEGQSESASALISSPSESASGMGEDEGEGAVCTPSVSDGLSFPSPRGGRGEMDGIEVNKYSFPFCEAT